MSKGKASIATTQQVFNMLAACRRSAFREVLAKWEEFDNSHGLNAVALDSTDQLREWLEEQVEEDE